MSVRCSLSHGAHSHETKAWNSYSPPCILSLQKFFLQEDPVVYVQALHDPSKALVLEEATLSWQLICPGMVNEALELEKNGHTSVGKAEAQPHLGALKPEDKRDRLAPELCKINLVVSQVA